MEERTIDKKQKWFGFGMMAIGVMTASIGLLKLTNVNPLLYDVLCAVFFLIYSLFFLFGIKRKYDDIRFSNFQALFIPIALLVILLLLVTWIVDFKAYKIKIICVILVFFGYCYSLSTSEQVKAKYKYVLESVLGLDLLLLGLMLWFSGDGRLRIWLLIYQGVLMIIAAVIYQKLSFQAVSATQKKSEPSNVLGRLFRFIIMLVFSIIGNMFVLHVPHIYAYSGETAVEHFPIENINISIPKNADHFELWEWDADDGMYVEFFSFKAPETEVQQWLASNPLGFDEYENYFTFEDAKAAEAELETLDREGRNELRYDGETTAIDEAINRETFVYRPLWFQRSIGEETRYDITIESTRIPFSVFIIYFEPEDDGWVKVSLYSKYNHHNTFY